MVKQVRLSSRIESCTAKHYWNCIYEDAAAIIDFQKEQGDESCRTTPWIANRRAMRYETAVEGVPKLLQFMLPKRSVEVYEEQFVSWSSNEAFTVTWTQTVLGAQDAVTMEGMAVIVQTDSGGVSVTLNLTLKATKSWALDGMIENMLEEMCNNKFGALLTFNRNRLEAAPKADLSASNRPLGSLAPAAKVDIAHTVFAKFKTKGTDVMSTKVFSQIAHEQIRGLSVVELAALVVQVDSDRLGCVRADQFQAIWNATNNLSAWAPVPADVPAVQEIAALLKERGLLLRGMKSIDHAEFEDIFKTVASRHGRGGSLQAALLQLDSTGSGQIAVVDVAVWCLRVLKSEPETVGLHGAVLSEPSANELPAAAPPESSWASDIFAFVTAGFTPDHADDHHHEADASHLGVDSSLMRQSSARRSVARQRSQTSLSGRKMTTLAASKGMNTIRRASQFVTSAIKPKNPDEMFDRSMGGVTPCVFEEADEQSSPRSSVDSGPQAKPRMADDSVANPWEEQPERGRSSTAPSRMAARLSREEAPPDVQRPRAVTDAEKLLAASKASDTPWRTLKRAVAGQRISTHASGQRSQGILSKVLTWFATLPNRFRTRRGRRGAQRNRLELDVDVDNSVLNRPRASTIQSRKSTFRV